MLNHHIRSPRELSNKKSNSKYLATNRVPTVDKSSSKDNAKTLPLNLDAKSNDNEGPVDSQTNVDLVVSAKDFKCDQEIADYMEYLKRPINLNDHYIKMCQYQCEFGSFPRKQLSEEYQFQSPTRRRNKKEFNRVEVVDGQGVCTINSPDYNNFLIKKDQNFNSETVIETATVCEATGEFDQHRHLIQSRTAVSGTRDSKECAENKAKVSQREVAMSPHPRTVFTQRDELLIKQFFSFRTAKKNKSGRRKKRVVISENGVDGPMWPAVLRTFDRNISSGSVASSGVTRV